ncbi:hypothetical protein [Paenibacillus methanolicus]|uniref:Uncharacterized protein n=1 Tax=Paenibacillus methanolicus TaxID=582686 RepID=A0A5S5BYT8_9BACL|nr:hypothetical protein [Paenibacillus methanolicus]TYP72109.1 hypothetical protein BCM02_109388 [Paenibacillus methanolicus]
MFKLLWRRRYYYFAGYILGGLIGLLNILLGGEIETNELITFPLGSCIIFGYLFYVLHKQRELLKEKGRMIIFSKDGLFHLSLNFGVLFMVLQDVKTAFLIF